MKNKQIRLSPREVIMNGSRLTINRQTIRLLTSHELSLAPGGGGSVLTETDNTNGGVQTSCVVK